MTVLAKPNAVAQIHLIGRAASPGLAIGPVTMITAAVARRTASGDPAQEAAALQAGIEGARAEIAELIKTVQGDVADILEFQVAMLEDDALADARPSRRGRLPTMPGARHSTRRSPAIARLKMSISVPVPRISSTSATACSRI
jgi:hypothetical protein